MTQPTAEPTGRTIQLFLVDGVPNGLTIASIHGWTGSVLIASQSTFDRLRARTEADRTGIYILYGPDPDDGLSMRAYVGEADCVRERINQSAEERGFWEMAVVVTTSDEALTKGDVRYLEARLIELAYEAGRVKLDNSQAPKADRRRLPEAGRANMEAFLANLKIVLPVIGIDLLKPRPSRTRAQTDKTSNEDIPQFEIRHKSGVKALALEQDGEFVVVEGSQALKNAGYSSTDNYGSLKHELVTKGILETSEDDQYYRFSKAYAFKSPSAAAAIILDRNSNGRQEWKVVDAKMSYHEWQESKTSQESADE